MRFTYEEAKALNIAHLWPSRTDKPASQTVTSGLPETANDPAMNKLETAFWERLQSALRQGIFTQALHEPMTLRLAGRTTYKPDFMTYCHFGHLHLTFWETKGFMRDDAAIKLKVAASAFPCFRWVLVQRDRGKWRCISVTDKGFSRDEWCPDWLR